MIEKWFCLMCDNCGEVINYWQRDSFHDAIEAEKKSGPPSIVTWGGTCFCNKKCQEEWLAKRRQAEKDQEEMDKIMRKFGGEE